MQEKISYASSRAPFDQINVSEKGTEPKIAQTTYDKVLRIRQLFG